MALRFFFLGSSVRTNIKKKSHLHSRLSAGFFFLFFFLSAQKKNQTDSFWKMWLNSSHVWTKRFEAFKLGFWAQTLTEGWTEWPTISPQQTDLKVHLPPPPSPPPAGYLQQYMFCNITLWVTLRAAGPPRGSAHGHSGGEEKQHFCVFAWVVSQTVAYLISCCVWLTSYLKVGTVWFVECSSTLSRES